MKRLISYALLENDSSIIKKFPSALMTEEEKEYVEFIDNHLQLYGTLPSMAAFQKEFPDFIPLTNYNKNDILKQEIDARKADEINKVFSVIDPNDIEEARELLTKLLSKLDASPIQQTLSLKNVRRPSLYFNNSKQFFFISDNITGKLGGIRKGEVITVIGKYGVSKSLVVEASIAEWIRQGERVLVISNDMSIGTTIARIDSFMSHQDVTQLDEDQIDVLDKTLNMLYNVYKGDAIVPNKPITFVEDIEPIAREFKPTVIVVDGAYLLKSMNTTKGGSRNWENLSSVTGELTRIAHDMNVPVILISQANRENDIAFSNSFGQDSDIVLLLRDDIEYDNSNLYKAVKIETIKNRRGASFSSYIIIDFKRFMIYDAIFH